WNRRAGSQLLSETFAAGRDCNIGIGMIDVDYFKEINDTFGHQAGDEVLRKVARLILSAVREGDILARYGGDEFLLIAKDIDGPAFEILAQSIRDRLQEFPIKTRFGMIPTTLTIGTANTELGFAITPENLIQRADEALMSIKAARPRRKRN
ncbi:MAG: GGDEF domain-containing protein, partial [Gammaproteobacteria bacterium]